ncbi:MAG: hypothetical protein RR162_01155 [Oscillospiraceae bacterium]
MSNLDVLKAKKVKLYEQVIKNGYEGKIEGLDYSQLRCFIGMYSGNLQKAYDMASLNNLTGTWFINGDVDAYTIGDFFAGEYEEFEPESKSLFNYDRFRHEYLKQYDNADEYEITKAFGKSVIANAKIIRGKNGFMISA